MKPAAILLLTLLTLTLAPAAAASDRKDSGPLEQRVERVSQGLRCPVCQSLSVWDSPSQVSEAMRMRIRDLARRGESDAQIRAYFVARYGDWILLSPPRHGIALAVWLAPLLILLAGAAAATATVSGWRRRARALAAVDGAALAAGRAQLAELEQRRLP